jgi:hypothetical protein
MCTQEPAQNDYAPADYTAIDVATAAVPQTPCKFCQLPFAAPPFNPRHAIRMCQTQALAHMAIPHTRRAATTTTTDQAMSDNGDDSDDGNDEDPSLAALELIQSDQAFHDGHCWMMWIIARFGDDMPLSVSLRQQLPHWDPSRARPELQAYFAGVMEQRRVHFEQARIPVVEVPLIPPDTSAYTADDGALQEAVHAAHTVMGVPDEHGVLPLPQWPVVTPEMFHAAAAAAAQASGGDAMPNPVQAIYEASLPAQTMERDFFME